MMLVALALAQCDAACAQLVESVRHRYGAVLVTEPDTTQHVLALLPIPGTERGYASKEGEPLADVAVEVHLDGEYLGRAMLSLISDGRGGAFAQAFADLSDARSEHKDMVIQLQAWNHQLEQVKRASTNARVRDRRLREAQGHRQATRPGSPSHLP